MDPSSIRKKLLEYAAKIVASLTHESGRGRCRTRRIPIDTLIRIVQSTSLKREDLQRGCLLNNPCLEMSLLDAGFRKANGV